MALRENGSDASKFDNIAFNNRFDTLVEALNLHRFAEEKCLWLRTVSTAFYFTSAQALELAQIVSKSDYLALLNHSLPGYVASAYLCEVLVFLFPRIVDLEEFISLVATLYPYEQITIRDRLGPLALLNPANPRGQWELDLESPDGNHVAAFFVYNKTFDGCKWENEMLNGHRFIMPTSWIQEIPSRGMLNVEYTEEPDAIEKEASLRAASKHMMKICLLGDPPRNSIIDLHRSNAIVRKAESMMMAHMESWYNEQIQNVCNRFVLSVKKCPVKYESVRDKIDMHKRYRSSIKKKLRNDWIEGRKSSYQKLVRLRRQSEMKTLEEAMEDAKGNGEAIVVERGARTSLENICETSANEKDRFAYQRTLPVFDNSFNDSSDDDEDEGNVFGSIRHWSHQHDDAITRARRTKEHEDV